MTTPEHPAINTEGSGCPATHFIDIRGYEAHAEVMRSNAIRSALSELTSDNVDVDSKYFRGGSLLRLDGPEHVQRRRVMNRLLRGDGHKRFRDTVLYPTLEHNLAEVFADADEHGVVSVELVTFLLRVNIQLVAAVIGLSGADTAEGAEDLLRLQRDISLGAADATVEPRFGLTDPTLLTVALGAMDEYTERFFKPSLEEHRAMLERVEAGTMSEAELPDDLLMLMATNSEPAWEDLEVAVRDSLLILRAGVNSSTRAACHTLDELRDWLVAHPEDSDRIGDPDFVLAVVNETLRLHPNGPSILRRAADDLELRSTGDVIEAGACAVLWTKDNNRDPSVFGSDAEEFNPYRAIPAGIYPHGLSFGVGPHRCFGLSIVLGDEGIDGSLVHVVRRLLAAGVRPDPKTRPTFEERVHAVHYETYPVLLTRESA